MKPLFELENNPIHGLRVTDVTLDSDEYLAESISDAEALILHKNNKFKYSETCTINIIEKHTIDSTGNLENTIEIIDINEHCSYLDEFYYLLKEDGYYTIHHAILPLKSCIDNDINEGSTINKDLSVYSTDGQNIYLGDKIISAFLLINVNPEETTISIAFTDLFSIYKLWDCFIKFCKLIFKNINFRCLSDKGLEDFIFKRDLLWMTINIIKYHVDFGLLWEALRLLLEMNLCGGLCNEQSMSSQSSSGCGCSK